jgi:hypothetical protein
MIASCSILEGDHAAPATVIRVDALASASAALAQTATKSDSKQVISTPNAPAAIGPYSQAIRVGNMVFLAGQIPIDPKNQHLMKDASIADQTRLVLENLKAVLEVDGLSMDRVTEAQCLAVLIERPVSGAALTHGMAGMGAKRNARSWPGPVERESWFH